MHLLCSLPLSLLWLLPAALASQTVLNTQPEISSTTIIDVLSDDPDYTSLLKLLQRALLIPTINKLDQATLFAPTNDAIDKHNYWKSFLDTSSQDVLRDNIREQLRQELLYHLLNYSLDPLPVDQNPQIHKTLLFPRKPTDPPTHEPPPSPPWLPIPGGTLGGEPQRLRLASVGGKVKVGVDAFGKGGASVTKGQVNAGNGMVLGINSVIDVPPDLATVATQQNSLSYFGRIVTPEIVGQLNSTPELTLFLPVDTAWDVLPPIERKYLESKFATDDIIQILNMHSVVTEGVHWSDSFDPKINLTTVSNSILEIVKSPETGKILVSSAELIEPDIFASNGVLHTVSSLLIPPGSFKVTPEKYLLTLNCSSFVSLLHSVDLTSLINNTEKEYTILAPRDDVLELFGGGKDGFPEKGSPELKRVLSYHFLPGKWTPKKLKDGMLVETALLEPGLDNGSQVLDIGVTAEDGKHKKERSISFGGASVMGEYYDVDNTLIYLVSRPLSPPPDALEAALPNLELSNFLAAVFSTSLAERLKEEPRTTFLIPENEGFKRLGGLVSQHLLSSTSKSDLEDVVLHHVLDGVEYASSIRNGSQKTYATLEGTDVRIDRLENGTVSVSASGGWSGMDSQIIPKNTLTKTGVVHEISDVLLPRSLDLTIGKLVKAAKGSTMATMLARAGMEWILNGTAPPDGSPWAEQGFENVGWTLLCPNDEAFKGYNLTRLYDEPEWLMSIVQQHLIPTPKPGGLPIQLDSLQSNRPLLLDDSATYTTLESNASAYGDIVFRLANSDDEKGATGYLVGIKNARGREGKNDWARVLAWGRTTTNGGVGGVIQIDSLLKPYRPPVWLEYGAPISVGIVGVLVIGVFFFGVRKVWQMDTTEATYEPVGGFDNSDDDS